MENDNKLLKNMPLSKAFFRLAVPAVAVQLINILYNLVDKMFIGRIPDAGKQALAGIGVYLAEPIADTIAICTTGHMFYRYFLKLK